MACPFFIPGSPLPLSELFSGECSANPATTPSREKLTRCCNPGYARTLCEHAATADVDSHRFLIRSDDGRTLQIAWATERNHHPIAVGTLTIDRAFVPGNQPLDHQALACAHAYFHQTGRL